jgi:hypothetical protein
MITGPFIAGLVYGLSVFALGFGLGGLRTLLLHPLVGEIWAITLEIPMMLAASWFICATLVHRMSVPPQWSDRLTMGGIALACVLVGEALISVGLFERTLAEHLALYVTPRSALGLLAQIAFALIPLAQLRRDAKGD